MTSTTARFGFAALLAAGLAAVAWFAVSPSTAEEARRAPPPTVDEQASGSQREAAVLAGGCFWGVQGVFQHVAGVVSAVSGYAGGAAATAHYEMTSQGDTGHAESVKITFDPGKISYGKILQIYFSVGARPDRAQPAGPRRRDAVPLRHLPDQRRAGAGC